MANQNAWFCADLQDCDQPSSFAQIITSPPASPWPRNLLKHRAKILITADGSSIQRRLPTMPPPGIVSYYLLTVTLKITHATKIHTSIIKGALRNGLTIGYLSCPLGNSAIFYKTLGYSSGLTKPGPHDFGVEVLNVSDRLRRVGLKDSRLEIQLSVGNGDRPR